MKDTAIQYADSTVNPWVGCTGCELWQPGAPVHCYAKRRADRYPGCKGWPKEFGNPEFFEGRIEKALKWADLTGTDRPGKPWMNGLPRVIFWGDMTDFWAKKEMSAWIEEYLDRLEQSPHIHLFVTKRANEMADQFIRIGHIPKNFWLVTTLTTQATLIRAYSLSRLRQVSRTAVLGISAEPLLGPLDLPDTLQMTWISVGGESGPKCRPMEYDWADFLYRWSRRTGTRFFFKQWGDYWPNPGAVSEIEGHKEMPHANR